MSTRRKMFVTVVVFAFSVGMAYGTCSNTSRDIDKSAGSDSGALVQEQCASVSIEVAGVSVSIGDRTCTSDKTVYDETIYKCQSSTTCGTNCKGHGFKASFTVYTGGGCMGIPTTYDEAIEFNQNSGCKSLDGSSQEDWSRV